MEVQELVREFKYNSVVLPDPNATFTLAQVRDFYAAVYPEINSAEFEGPEVRGNKNVYTLRRAVGTKGTDPERHAARTYLQTIRWDNVPRLDRWMIDYMSAQDTEYVKAVSSKWIIGAVARMLAPGSRIDNVLGIVGEQGSGKSHALQILGGEWFSDEPFHLHCVKGHVARRAKWIVELAAPDLSNKRDTIRLKQILTQGSYVYRPSPSSGSIEIQPHQVFAFTTSSTDFLSADPENRRFWVVQTGKVDTAGLTRVRDQLWAETTARFLRGELWWMNDPRVSITVGAEPVRQIISDLLALVEIDWFNRDEAAMIRGANTKLLSGRAHAIHPVIQANMQELHDRFCSRKQPA